jgi:hypothetical protein
VPHRILQVCIIILYENVFQNPELFPTQVSLYPEKSTLAAKIVMMLHHKLESCKEFLENKNLLVSFPIWPLKGCAI